MGLQCWQYRHHRYYQALQVCSTCSQISCSAVRTYLVGVRQRKCRRGIVQLSTAFWQLGKHSSSLEHRCTLLRLLLRAAALSGTVQARHHTAAGGSLPWLVMYILLGLSCQLSSRG